MKNFNDVTNLEQAVRNLSPVQIVGMVNGLIEIMHEQGADAIDLDAPEYRLDKIRYNSEKNEIFLHFEELEEK
jgi:hypothetical protein